MHTCTHAHMHTCTHARSQTCTHVRMHRPACTRTTGIDADTHTLFRCTRHTRRRIVESSQMHHCKEQAAASAIPRTPQHRPRATVYAVACRHPVRGAPTRAEHAGVDTRATGMSSSATGVCLATRERNLANRLPAQCAPTQRDDILLAPAGKNSAQWGRTGLMMARLRRTATHSRRRKKKWIFGAKSQII